MSIFSTTCETEKNCTETRLPSRKCKRQSRVCWANAGIGDKQERRVGGRGRVEKLSGTFRIDWNGPRRRGGSSANNVLFIDFCSSCFSLPFQPSFAKFRARPGTQLSTAPPPIRLFAGLANQFQPVRIINNRG